MSQPGYWPIRTTVNQDFEETFTFLQADGVTPYDISAWVFELEVRDTWGGTLLYTVTPQQFQIIGASGELTVIVAVGIMASLGALDGVYDLLATASGVRTSWFHGPFIAELGSGT